jgi:hypothetical protein
MKSLIFANHELSQSAAAHELQTDPRTMRRYIAPYGCVR